MIADAWIFLIPNGTIPFLCCHKPKLGRLILRSNKWRDRPLSCGRFLFVSRKYAAIAIRNGNDDFSIASIPLNSF